MPRLSEIIDVLEDAYPPSLAEDWDQVGLVCGDPDALVDRVAIAVDATDGIVDDALSAGADLLLVHHPPLLRGVHSISTASSKGRILHRLILANCALFAAHTNADSARPGVNDALARTLGLEPGRPLSPAGDSTIDRWVVTVPGDEVERVLAAVFDVGAGEMNGYSGCAFSVEGKGQFVPGVGTTPTIGQIGTPEQVAEVRVEFVAESALRESVRSALIAAHPYEVPAYDVLVSHTAPNSGPQGVGMGRLCELEGSISLREFTSMVADKLPPTAWGVRAAGDPDTPIRRIALCGGAGDSLLSAARAAGADVYLTGDLRHHVVDEFLRDGGPALVDAAHWALEFPWCGEAAELIAARTGATTSVLSRRTDPWTVWACGPE